MGAMIYILYQYVQYNFSNSCKITKHNCKNIKIFNYKKTNWAIADSKSKINFPPKDITQFTLQLSNTNDFFVFLR